MSPPYIARRPSISADVARKIKVESGHCCAVAKCSEHTYLEIHHIDLDRENNDPKNLILLCYKHHKMAHANVIDRKALKQYKDLLAAAILNPLPDDSLNSIGALRVVDIYEVEDYGAEGDESITAIEIKMVNRGKQVAFVKEVRATTLKHWETLTDRHHSLVSVSADYDLKICREVASVSRLKVHHEIKPQETDRVVIRLESDYESDPDGLSLFLIKFEVLYDEDDNSVLAPLVIANICPKYVSAASFFSGYQKGTIPKNKAVASEVLHLVDSGVVVNQGVVDALESWRNAPEEN
ncbi:HNH endonuclease signature motif containing protein [Pseudomonas aeruginosa]|uniref:HNH endonuclease signature motif containing protein n=1 Tax=Pseudomonas aeruginosa TaxID=287 RepID=UPI002F40CE0C